MAFTTTALVLAVVASLGWGAFDAVRKVLTERVSPTALVVLLGVGQIPVFAAWWALDGGGITSLDYALPAAVTVAINIPANWLFLTAIQRSPISVTIPMLSWTPVFTTLLAIPLLGEVPSTWQWGGIALVVLGTFGLTAGGADGLRDMVRAVGEEPGVWMMTLVAVLWAGSSSFDKLALRHAHPAAHAVVLNAGVVVGMAVWLAVRRRTDELRVQYDDLGPLGLAIVAASVALGFQLAAMMQMFVGLLEAMKRAIGMSLSVVTGRVLFGEEVVPRKLVGVAVIASGIGMILLPGAG